MSGRSRQLVDALNADLAQLITESKRKSPEVKLVPPPSRTPGPRMDAALSPLASLSSLSSLPASHLAPLPLSPL